MELRSISVVSRVQKVSLSPINNVDVFSENKQKWPECKANVEGSEMIKEIMRNLAQYTPIWEKEQETVSIDKIKLQVDSGTFTPDLNRVHDAIVDLI